MTLANTFQSLGITVLAKSPLVVADKVSPVDLTERLKSYSHEISAFGGFRSAAISFYGLDKSEAESWFSEGLGRDILVTGPSTTPIFEGFANNVGLALGSLAATRGPLTGLANRVLVLYVPILDATVNPPIVGVRQPTTLVEDTTSQGLFGKWEKTLSGGQALQTYIEIARDTYLAEHKYPETSEQRVSLSQGSDPEISLDVSGYSDWLDAYPYINLTPATQQVTTKLKAVLNADTNAIFSTDQSQIADVLTLVSGYENEYRSATTVIKDLVSIGDASFNRVLFQIMDGRKAYFYSLPTETKYYHRLIDESLVIEKADGSIVYPWDVRPGQWLFIPDFLVGRVSTTVKREDPRYIFIETVRYSAPFDLEINGAKIETLPQKLSQYGLGGLSA